VMRYGMAAELGQVVFDVPGPAFLEGAPSAPSERQVSNATAEQIDQAVKTLVEAAYTQAGSLLAQRRSLLDDMASQLLAHETLDEPALQGFAAQARAG